MHDDKPPTERSDTLDYRMLRGLPPRYGKAFVRKRLKRCPQCGHAFKASMVYCPVHKRLLTFR